MSDLETLVVTFQTKLSDVMETVMKTAMYEVTRLVEDGLLLEMKRRNREMESLRTKLLLAEKKLIGQEEKDPGRKSNRDSCVVAAVNLSRCRIEEEKGKFFFFQFLNELVFESMFVSVSHPNVFNTNSIPLFFPPSYPG